MPDLRVRRRPTLVALAVAGAAVLGLGLSACDTVSDIDGDGIPTTFEHYYGFNSNNPDENLNSILDGDEDHDGDDLTTRYETLTYQSLNPNGYTLNPYDADSDDDGLTDSREITGGSDPLDPNSTATCGATPSGAATNC